MRKLAFVLSLLFLVASSLPGASADLVLILDASGSMWGQIEGENKIVIARQVVGDLVDGLDEGQEVALVAYGHRREGDCEDIETVVPLGPVDKAGLKAKVEGLNPKGKTPITASLQEAVDLVKARDGAATVVLVSDGLETCGGDPCKLVRDARAGGVELILHVVGFDIAKEDVSQLECAAQAGGGLFLSAENADELAAALETAVALPADEPAGRLSVKGTKDGELVDLSVRVTNAVTGEAAGGGRTYTDPSTNPRLIPLADGRYDVAITAVGLKGEAERSFEGVEIRDGETVEKVVDFSSGEVAVEVKRNGELSDATISIYPAGGGKSIAGGRTYRSASSNPKVLELTAGTYDLEIGSVEIAGKPLHRWEGIVVEPEGRVELAHEYESATVAIGARRGEELVDALVRLRDAAGKQVDGGRTYTSESSNPKSFVVEPGTYTVSIKELKGETKTLELTLEAGDDARHVIDFAAP